MVGLEPQQGTKKKTVPRVVLKLGVKPQRVSQGGQQSTNPDPAPSQTTRRLRSQTRPANVASGSRKRKMDEAEPEPEASSSKRPRGTRDTQPRPTRKRSRAKPTKLTKEQEIAERISQSDRVLVDLDPSMSAVYNRPEFLGNFEPVSTLVVIPLSKLTFVQVIDCTNCRRRGDTCLMNLKNSSKCLYCDEQKLGCSLTIHWDPYHKTAFAKDFGDLALHLAKRYHFDSLEARDSGDPVEGQPAKVPLPWREALRSEMKFISARRRIINWRTYENIENTDPPELEELEPSPEPRERDDLEDMYAVVDPAAGTTQGQSQPQPSQEGSSEADDRNRLNLSAYLKRRLPSSTSASPQRELSSEDVSSHVDQLKDDDDERMDDNEPEEQDDGTFHTFDVYI